jgi:hypothetical protein
MRLLALLVPGLVLAGLSGSASSEEVERYRLEKTDNGYVRMDTVTGQMSICEERTGQLICKMAADERAAFQDEIDRLQAKLDDVEARVAKLESRAIPEVLLPSDEQVDKSLDLMEKFFQRFMGMMRDLDKDTALPRRT